MILKGSLLHACAALALLVLAWRPVIAHGPTPQKAEEKIAIAAPPAAVWAIVREFGGLASWHPAVARCTGERGTAAGAQRTLTLKSGGVLVDGLDEFDEAGMFYRYRLAKENIAAFPVSFYSAKLQVTAAEGGSEVAWTGRFYRADTGNFPAEGQDDAAAVEAMSAFFREGLAGLKKRAEGGVR